MNFNDAVSGFAGAMAYLQAMASHDLRDQAEGWEMASKDAFDCHQALVEMGQGNAIHVSMESIEAASFWSSPEDDRGVHSHQLQQLYKEMVDKGIEALNECPAEPLGNPEAVASLEACLALPVGEG